MKKIYKIDGVDMTETEIAKRFFGHILERRFWLGVLSGVVLAAAIDMTDIHLRACIGNCDGVSSVRIGK